MEMEMADAGPLELGLNVCPAQPSTSSRVWTDTKYRCWLDVRVRRFCRREHNSLFVNQYLCLGYIFTAVFGISMIRWSCYKIKRTSISRMLRTACVSRG